MILSKREAKQLLQVKREIENGYNNGDLRLWHNIPYLIDDCRHCYQSIICDSGHAGTTLTSENAEYFRKRGFSVKEHGIGFTVSIAD